MSKEEIRYIFGGDLLGQLIATIFWNFGVRGSLFADCTEPVQQWVKR